ncbi:MAG: carboxylesterase [Candidatus Parabeggiatoa sp. nov. 3]|nr:MAG: carboxylesterase [Gammaproteobacteria bacterium]RKZ55070.1 MAG: carboxylesterase [Gammaproteobacteria bacterium]RKZ76177.1 MAG: carboxylesterase [Gammaproteobacteria bacterium]
MKSNAVIIEPPKQARAAVIWLHGLGANGHDFKPILPALPKTMTDQTRFIFPHAPQRPITINGGMVMPGWYDVLGMDLTAQQDAKGIRDSEDILCHYITHEIERGILAQSIVLAGFSQGGAIALHTGLRYPIPLAGIMALSTYLPLADTLENEIHAANRKTSIFMGHGLWDPVILFSQAERSRAELEKLGYPVEWHSYQIQHSLNPDEIVDIGKWLTALLPHDL